MRQSYFLNAIITLFVLLAGVGRADVFDLTSDYSTTSTSLINGVWSFGWKLENALDSSSLNLFDQNLNDTGAHSAFNYWHSQAIAGSLPLVGKYQSATDSQLQNGTIFNANQVALHAGSTGGNVAVSVVRFTAPQTGSYHLDQAVFEYRSDIPGNNVYIYFNGTQLLQQTQSVRGTQVSLSPSNFNLVAGDHLDFMVGSRGGAINSTTTQLNAVLTLTAVPEPSSAFLVAMVGIGLSMKRIRSRRN